MNLTGAREAQKSFSLICASKRDAVGKCFFNPLKGFLSIYDSARLCSRCGACAQACPSYKVLKGEVFSPRGRNQLLRFILDGRFKDGVNKKDFAAPILTCIMCAKCAAVCPVFAPTYAHMGALKFFLNMGGGISAPEIFFLKFFINFPSVFFLLKNIFRKIPDDKHPQAFYLPSVFGLDSMKKNINIIKQKYAGVSVMKSGLLLARTALTGGFNNLTKVFDNIQAEYERRRAAADKIPIITDSIEDFRLLKHSAALGEKYKDIAANAHFVSEFIKPLKVKNKEFGNKKILLQNNNIFFCNDEIIDEIRQSFICGKNKFLVKLELEAHGAGLLPYCKIKGAQAIKQNLAAALASRRADVFVVLSYADKAFFDKLLKVYYPYTKVLHIAELFEYFYGN